jgi:hypothetical protein
MGYARNFQPPSFFNPFSGYYGANTGMGGFQSQFGGFQQPQFGGFGGFQQPQFGGFGGFGGGFQQPQYGGFQQDGFGGQFNRFTRRGQEYTQPYMPQPQPYDPRSQRPTIPNRELSDLQFLPQPMPIGGGAFQPGVGNQRIDMGAAQPTTGGSLFSSFTSTQPTTPYSTVNPYANETDAQRNERIGLMTGRVFTRGGMGLRQDGNAMPTALPTYAQLTDDGYGSLARERIGAYGGGYGGFNPMMGGGIGAFGDRGFMGYR